MKTGASTVFRQPKVDFDPAGFETKQVFFTSKDGTRVPMFLTHRKGLKLDGRNPTLLYGYGGFDISLTPVFSVGTAVWMEDTAPEWPRAKSSRSSRASSAAAHRSRRWASA